MSLFRVVVGVIVIAWALALIHGCGPMHSPSRADAGAVPANCAGEYDGEGRLVASYCVVLE